MCWKMPARVLLSWIEARLAWSIAPHKKEFAKSHKPWTKSLAPQDITTSITNSCPPLYCHNQSSWLSWVFFLLFTYEMIGRLRKNELSSKTKQLFLSGRQSWQILVQPNNIGLTTGLWQLRRAARHWRRRRPKWWRGHHSTTLPSITLFHYLAHYHTIPPCPPFHHLVNHHTIPPPCQRCKKRWTWWPSLYYFFPQL